MCLVSLPKINRYLNFTSTVMVMYIMNWSIFSSVDYNRYGDIAVNAPYYDLLEYILQSDFST